MLRGQKDKIGEHICDDYTISSALRRFRELHGCVVRIAYDYYGSIVLRVFPKKEMVNDGMEI